MRNYTGERSQNTPHGQGIGPHVIEGTLFTNAGEWSNGHPHGRSEGEAKTDCTPYLQNSSAHGGEFEYLNGYVRYEGSYKYGRFDGNGLLKVHGVSMTDDDDTLLFQLDGRFENGCFVEGQLTIGEKNVCGMPKGAFVYKGQFSKEDVKPFLWLPHGKGTLTYTNGDSYEGHFENGQPVNMPTLPPSDVEQQLLVEQRKVKELQAQLKLLRADAAGQKRKREDD